ncbi:MAG: hypothetical protein QM813_02080 [Verrucomicrobiota bacterium]
MLTRLYYFFSSVKLAVVLLALGLILVFWGTIAQVKLGLYMAQDEFFRSLFIYWKPEGSGLKIPIFPGGYLVGGLLLINLFAAHLRYYRSGLKRLGIAMIHLGVVLLLLGQFMTDMLSVESHMSIREGESSNFSESGSRWELAIVDTTDEKDDKVIAIPATLLQKGGELAHPDMPFKLRAKTYFPNSALTDSMDSSGFEPVAAESAAGRPIWWRSLPKETHMNLRDIPSGVVELVGPQGETRSVLVSGYISTSLALAAGGRNLSFVLRPERYYKPYYLHLIDFRFDRLRRHGEGEKLFQPHSLGASRHGRESRGDHPHERAVALRWQNFFPIQLRQRDGTNHRPASREQSRLAHAVFRVCVGLRRDGLAVPCPPDQFRRQT